MKTEAVIFDLDGTLLDTLEDLGDSMNSVLKENGFPQHRSDNYSYFIGNGARKLVERALPEGHKDELSVNRYLVEWLAAYGQWWNVKTKPYVGIMDMLLKLRELRIPLAILSNKPHDDVLKLVAHYFDDSLFSSITGQKDHIPHKPSPDGAFLICEQFGVLPDKCIFVGDTSVDMETAKVAGMTAIGVSWGFRPVRELLESGADSIINKPEELLSLL